MAIDVERIANAEAQGPNQELVTSSESQHPIVDTDLYFGACPKCGQSKHLNVGRNHWACCPEHKVRWPVGENLFSSWHYETPEIWERNARQLDDYEIVEPIYPSEARLDHLHVMQQVMTFLPPSDALLREGGEALEAYLQEAMTEVTQEKADWEEE